MMEAIDLYRRTFQPSDQLDRPYVMLGFNAFVAETDDEAQLLATSVQQAFVALRTGQPVQLPPPSRDFADTLPTSARAMLDSLLSCSAIGSVVTARRQLDDFLQRTQADELIVTSQIFDHAARIRSFELLAEAGRRSSRIGAP